MPQFLRRGKFNFCVPFRAYHQQSNISSTSLLSPSLSIITSSQLQQQLHKHPSNSEAYADERPFVEDKDIHACTIVKIQQVTSEVRWLLLKPTSSDPINIANNKFSFKPGQWVDFFIPGEPVVGGYSLCSAPRSFETHGKPYWLDYEYNTDFFFYFSSVLSSITFFFLFRNRDV